MHTPGKMLPSLPKWIGPKKSPSCFLLHTKTFQAQKGDYNPFPEISGSEFRTCRPNLSSLSASARLDSSGMPSRRLGVSARLALVHRLLRKPRKGNRNTKSLWSILPPIHTEPDVRDPVPLKGKWSSRTSLSGSMLIRCGFLRSAAKSE